MVLNLALCCCVTTRVFLVLDVDVVTVRLLGVSDYSAICEDTVQGRI